ncbi:MAG: DUF881 domain-containing protein [Patescibacteria group bacterium]
MLKRTDYIIITIICFFLGIFLVSQYVSGKEYIRTIQPENNAVIALEVAKMTKTNSNLRREVADLTDTLNTYNNSELSTKEAYDNYQKEIGRLNIINGETEKTGQGITIAIDGVLETAQVVDLVNALKNIGAEIISINGQRLIINTELGQFAYHNNYEIKVLGNSQLLKSALERRGGIIEQITDKKISINVAENDKISVPSANPVTFRFSKVVN